MIEATSPITQGIQAIPERHTVNRVSGEFQQVLSDALRQVNDSQIHAEQLHTQLAAGQIDSLHQVTAAAEKASLSLQLALQVRNKAVEAYQEMMRMQL